MSQRHWFANVSDSFIKNEAWSTSPLACTSFNDSVPCCVFHSHFPLLLLMLAASFNNKALCSRMQNRMSFLFPMCWWKYETRAGDAVTNDWRIKERRRGCLISGERTHSFHHQPFEQKVSVQSGFFYETESWNIRLAFLTKLGFSYKCRN